MSSHNIYFSGIGLCSPIAGFKDACAAFYAGLNRFDTFDTMANQSEDAVNISIAPAATNLEGYQGVAKTVKMLNMAFDDLCDNLKAPLPQNDLCILTAMPEPQHRQLALTNQQQSWQEQLNSYISMITMPLFNKLAADNPVLSSAPMQWVFGDRVAFARILNKAIQLINEGSYQHCLLMVADSLINRANLDTLQDAQQVKTDNNPVGFIAGESAAMILLSNQAIGEHAFSLNIQVASDESTIEQAIAQVEPQTPDEENEQQIQLERNLWQGEKLMPLIKQLISQNYENQWFPRCFSDINGTEYRAVEFGNLQVKLKQAYPKAYFMQPLIPSLSFGEQGTMTGPLAFACAIAGMQRGLARHNEMLITLSEQSGKRAAIALRM
ncbi:hypothetical protein [Aliikangiella maris]|uniref:Uncharacterized protein n=2 Tax=Aliikangiella maris TaxID=3162458 RepID=A0ABV3MNB0_9GAMM